MAEDGSLENAMSRVLAALAENHAATGSDNWEGKPQQEPLPISFEPLAATGSASEPTIEVVAGDPEDELNQMMSTYVRAVAKLRQTEKSVDTAVGNDAANQSQSATTGSSKYDQMSLAELMGELDAATE